MTESKLAHRHKRDAGEEDKKNATASPADNMRRACARLEGLLPTLEAPADNPGTPNEDVGGSDMAVHTSRADTTSVLTPERFCWTSADGLKLSARNWVPPHPVEGMVPLLCLAGLSRNSRDFNALARHLAAQGRQVIAMDYRGRGESDHDPDWQNYAIQVESADIEAGLNALQLNKIAILGTSRGGLHAMVLAMRLPRERIAAIILNDVGPRVELKAMRRIAATTGKSMDALSWKAMADRLQVRLGNQFTKLSKEEWEQLARQLCRETKSGITLDYDQALAHTLDSIEEVQPWREMWDLYEALTKFPLLVIRGENSDLLSRETFALMAQLHPRCESLCVPHEGHAPLLWDEKSQTRIADFLHRMADAPEHA